MQTWLSPYCPKCGVTFYDLQYDGSDLAGGLQRFRSFGVACAECQEPLVDLRDPDMWCRRYSERGFVGAERKLQGGESH